MEWGHAGWNFGNFITINCGFSLQISKFNKSVGWNKGVQVGKILKFNKVCCTIIQKTKELIWNLASVFHYLLCECSAQLVVCIITTRIYSRSGHFLVTHLKLNVWTKISNSNGLSVRPGQWPHLLTQLGNR